MSNRSEAATGFVGDGQLRAGLTKRENAAIQAMNGLLSSASDEGGLWSGAAKDVALEAVTQADALFDVLEKEAK